MVGVLQDFLYRVRLRLFRKVRHRRQYLKFVSGKNGLEIGGPSGVFRPNEALSLYEDVGSLDNCNFARLTVWAEHQDDFVFLEGKRPGRTILCEGSDLSPVADGSYDFVLSCHNLEHFANPVKALYEWKRVLRPGGALIVVLPNYNNTFDHRRSPTNVDHMFEDFHRNVGEDDLTHLPEIVEKHDLAMDPGGLSSSDFRARCEANLDNRCLHHHVFDERNSRELLERAGFVVRSVDKAFPIHICLLATPR
jgi:SAM-dependent methyltransferase